MYLLEGSIKDTEKLLSKNQSGYIKSDILETMPDSHFLKIFFNIVKIQIQREFSGLMTYFFFFDLNHCIKSICEKTVSN